MSSVENLSTEQIIKETSGTVRELKDFVNESELTEKQVQKLLSAEKENKDRKTARKFLERKKRQVKKNRELSEAEKEIRDVEEKIRSVEEKQVERETYDLDAPEIINILSDSEKNIKETVKERKFARENLEELIESEKNFKNRESVIDILRTEIEKIQEAEKFAQAEEDVKDLEEKISEISNVETSSEEKSAEEKETKENEESQEEHEERNSEDEEEPESEETEDDDSMAEEEKEDSDEESKSSEENLEDLIEEKPGEVLDKVDKMSVDDIEKLTFEEKLREELIEDLEDDFDPEKLKEVSTRDLIKLRAELEEKSEKDEEEEDESDKDKEAMEEEAEEDLQMLMGAGISEEKVDESESKLSQIENFKQGLKEKLNREEDEEEEQSTGIDKDQVLKVLEDYKELPEKEAAIKTAHIMKGYLEYRKGVERELTYSELADKLEESDESEKELSEYFEKMSKDEYTGNVDIDAGKIIETSRKVVKKLS